MRLKINPLCSPPRSDQLWSNYNKKEAEKHTNKSDEFRLEIRNIKMENERLDGECQNGTEHTLKPCLGFNGRVWSTHPTKNYICVYLYCLLQLYYLCKAFWCSHGCSVWGKGCVAYLSSQQPSRPRKEDAECQQAKALLRLPWWLWAC